MAAIVAPTSMEGAYAHPHGDYPYHPPEAFEGVPPAPTEPLAVPPPAVVEEPGVPASKQPKKRWNPILGTFVSQVVSENELIQEARQSNIDSYRSAMTKVIKREGNFDPVFWRHRVTGEQAGQALPVGRKRLGREPAHAVADVLRVECGAPSPVRIEPTWSTQKQVDHVRQLMNQEELRAEGPSRAFARKHRQADHVKSLIHQEALTAEEDRLLHFYGKKPHQDRRDSKDLGVASLLNEERARRLPDSAPHRNRSALGEVMRSGTGLRMVLNPALAGPVEDPHQRSVRSPQRPSNNNSNNNNYPDTSSPPLSATFRATLSAAPYGTNTQGSPSMSPPRPARPDWLDHEVPPNSATMRATRTPASSAPPARPNWLIHDPPPSTSPSKAWSRPAYMDYSALMTELVPRDNKIRR